MTGVPVVSTSDDTAPVDEASASGAVTPLASEPLDPRATPTDLFQTVDRHPPPSSDTSTPTWPRTPDLDVPLDRHFEQQQLHEPQRQAQTGAGRRMAYAYASDAEALADAITTEIDRAVDYRPVQTDGAARAAAMLSDLL
jgi:hypothetical protein